MHTGYYVKENINNDITVLLYGGLYRIVCNHGSVWLYRLLRELQSNMDMIIMKGLMKGLMKGSALRDTQVLQAVLT